jgi:hypothetical protein
MGVTVPRTSALSMFEDSPLVLNSQVIVTNKLMNYCKILYGVTPENLPIELFKSVIKILIERFPQITVKDIENSFEYTIIEKREYTSLTRDELLQPIRDYWNTKILVKSQIDKIQKEKYNEQIGRQKYLQFISLCKQKYIDSLKEKKCLLDEFESSAIARNFSNCLNDTEKAMLWKQARIEYKERVEDSENNKFGIVPSAEKIYSRLFIEVCIHKNITIGKKD